MKYLAIILFLTAPLLLISQCDSKVKPIPGSTGYKSRGKHCEGFYRSLVSATDLQIVHFTKGKLTYSSSEAQNIELSIPVKTQDT
ncbi:MAG: hypothetical protein AAFO07_24415, partial [Bacteroidota bacterium]